MTTPQHRGARKEPGAEVVASRIRSGERVVISAVSWAEAAGKLREYRMTPVILRQALAAVEAEILGSPKRTPRSSAS